MATILLAEDTDILRHVVSRALEAVDFDVIPVRSAAETLEVLHAGAAVDCIVSDVGPPGRNSRASRPRRTGSQPPISMIYVSGHPYSSAVQRYPIRPGAPYPPKPFGLDDLPATILQLVPDPQGPGVA